MRDLIHFAHANSFPAGCYRKLLGALADQFDTAAIERIGHDVRYPVSDNWPNLVDELIASVEGQGRPVIGVGHSLGGLLTYMAAIRRPELFRALVILDSPLRSPWRARGLWLAKRLGLLERMPMASGALRRRDFWDNVDDLHAYLRSKPVFARFDADVLRDYAESGSEPYRDGVRLAFRPDIEYRIYCALPHAVPRYRKPLSVPSIYLVGSRTNVANASDLAFLRHKVGMLVREVDGGHLYPLETPLQTAEAIRQAINDVLAATS